MSDDGADRQEAPVVQVVRGRPGDGELAALVAVLCARAAAAVPASPRPKRSLWGDPAALLRGGTSSLGWRGGPAARS